MYKNIIKRVIDFIGAFMLLMLLTIPFLIIAYFIKKDSKGKVFFIQRRVGKNKKYFNIIKFRSMVSNASEIGGASTVTNDPRITKFGFFLRKFSIDELPQIINVFKGDMSFVGYRPGINLNNDDEYQIVYEGKPGITGLAQVSGRSLLTPDLKSKFDIYYAENVSFLLDLKIIFMTIPALLDRKTIN